ncbi:MAG: DUF3365 domain-containing protein [Desulfonatronovibrionaceae bacterium]
MRLKQPLSLQSKFLAGLAFIAVILGCLFMGILYFHMQSLLVSQISDKANLALTQANSVQEYVRSVLRPRLFKEFPKHKFVIQAMSSSYVSRKVMEKMEGENKGFYYRRVALNARNKKYSPNKMEKDLIRYFQENPHLKHFEGFKQFKGLEYYFSARPVKFTKSCMHCHGDPADAPEELIAKYGNKRGFEYDLNRIAGAVVVGFPVQASVKRIKDITLGYMVLYLACVLLFFTLISIYFQRLVVHNLHRVTGIFRRHFSEPQDVEILDSLKGKDEIEELVWGVETLADHLQNTRHKLQEYAGNLEEMVNERTRDLSREVTERHKDVHLFIRFLNCLNIRSEVHSLLDAALENIYARYDLQYAAYIDAQPPQKVYLWPIEARLDKVSYTDISAKMGPDSVLKKNRLTYVKVRSQETVWGILILAWKTEDGHGPEKSRDLLDALGQQLGIALENIQSLYEVMYHYEMLQTLFDGISDPLFLVEEHGWVRMANQAARELDSSLQDDGTFMDFLNTGEADKAGVLTACLDAQKPWASDVRLPDGRSFWVSVYPLPAPGNMQRRAVLYARENTAEKEMVDRMQRAEKLSAVGKLAAGLAHEINNPLGVIICYVDLLRSNIENEEGLSDLEVIKKHAGHAQKVLQDLLNFARPKPALTTGKCDLNRLINSSMHVFQVQAERRGVELAADLHPELPVLEYSSNAFDQILTNLLLNALDAVEENTGRIRISTALSKDKSWILLTVADNGPGIEEKVKEHLFDPFYTTKEVGQGTGLGLAVVYGLVQELGGKIEVKNSGGAVFTIYIPCESKKNEQ